MFTWALRVVHSIAMSVIKFTIDAVKSIVIEGILCNS